ncbi:MAG: hypothetical protein RL291_1842, partial [Pseudomonadota bacterium]
MRLSTSLTALSMVLAGSQLAHAQSPGRPAPTKPDPIPTAVQTSAGQYEALAKARKPKGTAREALDDARKLARAPATIAQSVDRYLDAAQLDMNSAVVWLELADTLLALPPKDGQDNGRVHAANAAAAAALGYRRAKTDGERARALATLSKSFERRGQHR